MSEGVSGRWLPEAEARKKWCPWARYSSSGNVSINRLSDGSHNDRAGCLGSKCMAWERHSRDKPDTGRCGNIRSE